MAQVIDNKPEFLIIHHSWSPDNQKINDWEAIRKYHMSYRYNGVIISAVKALKLSQEGKTGIEKPWNDIGYHYGIEYVNGTPVIQAGRVETMHGAHCAEAKMNFRSLGICVVGCYDDHPPDKKAFEVLVNLCILKCKTYHITVDKIRPHQDYATYKTCPGRSFPMDDLRKRVGEVAGNG